ncbi:MAG TPA: HDOD domain-containing protein, partial [Rhodocyclaceae bacterium]|nr:HDOD domain-containing protein [Rhodocyclaceae bacterium]
MTQVQSKEFRAGSGMNAAASAGGGTRDIRGKLAMARLPSMPQVLLRLLDLCHKEDVSLNDLAGVVGRDAGMAAR